MTIQYEELTFLQERAEEPGRAFSATELAVLNKIKEHLVKADEVVVRLGGKAGRLGETVVATALLEGLVQTLTALDKTNVHLRVIVDENARELFDEKLYQQHYGLQTIFEFVLHTQKVELRGERNVLAMDFHGQHDGPPRMKVDGEVMALEHLFRVGVRNYAGRGSLRRYADFFEDLFSLPAGSLHSEGVQPRLYLSAKDERSFPELQQRFGLDQQAWLIVCFFQSMVLAKCYEKWDEVMQLFCAKLAQERPGEQADFLVACGPDSEQPEGFKRQDMEDWLRGFRGTNENARVSVRETPSLRDLGVLVHGARMVLANDTGPGHIAGALGVPTITPYLPGNLYSQRVWAATLQHHGVTLEPNPYSFEQLKAAVLWGRTEIINQIEPEQLATEMWRCMR
jgi:hypothetical protein